MNIEEQELESLYQATVCLERPFMYETLESDGVHFDYDPLPWAEFILEIRPAIEAAKGKRFLDIGCGLGTKLAYMNYMGWEVSGIERHEPYLKYARQICPFASLIHADAFDISAFDVDLIYMYQPMRSEEDEAALEAHVVSGMSKGAVLYLPARPLKNLAGTESISQYVWRKQ